LAGGITFAAFNGQVWQKCLLDRGGAVGISVFYFAD
jgi:hypothetical protein